jgi:hypothetical protein
MNPSYKFTRIHPLNTLDQTSKHQSDHRLTPSQSKLARTRRP